MNENWDISCHISKQMKSQSAALAAITEGELVSPEETQDVKNAGYWSQIAEVDSRGMISVSPDSCIFP